MEGGLDPMVKINAGPGIMNSGQEYHVKLGIFPVRDGAEIPEYATPGSAAFDLRAYLKNCVVKINGEKWEVNGKLTLKPGNIALIPSGLIFDIPQGYVLKLFARSSLPLKRGLNLGNSVAIIDSDYVEETYIMLRNFSEKNVVIEHGERIAQGILEQVIPVKLEAITARPEQKTNRQGGMGSTGRS